MGNEGQADKKAIKPKRRWYSDILNEVIAAAVVGVIANLLASIISTRTLPNIPTNLLVATLVIIALIVLLATSVILIRSVAKKRRLIVKKLREKEKSLFLRIDQQTLNLLKPEVQE